MTSANDTFEELVVASRAYLSWCEGPCENEAEEAHLALRHLSKLYALGLALDLPDDPIRDVDSSSMSDQQWARICKRTSKAIPFSYYQMYFRPFNVIKETPEPVMGVLGDDLADIARDLADALSIYDSGFEKEAQYEFADSFRIHWGRHATDAMQALQTWVCLGMPKPQ